MSKLWLLVSAVFLATGCADRQAQCDRLFIEKGHVKKLFPEPHAATVDRGSVCDSRPFSSYRLHEIMDETYSSCTSVCKDEHVEYFTSMSRAANEESGFCNESDREFAQIRWDRFKLAENRLMEDRQQLRSCLLDHYPKLEVQIQ